MKQKKHKSKPKTLPSYQLPFEDSLILIILNKCQKIIHELQRMSLKMAKNVFFMLDHDLQLLTKNHPDYGRILSLTLNIRAIKNQKEGKLTEALNKVDEAIELEKAEKIDKIDKASSLLNKSIILEKMNKKDNNEQINQQSMGLVDQALSLIQRRPKYKLITREHIKLGQLLLTLFYFFASELSSLQIQKQPISLYKKAYKLSVESLGQGHHLTSILKNTINLYKKQKKREKRAYTEGEADLSQASKLSKPKKKMVYSKKYQSFFKVYGYSIDSKKKVQTEAVEMKELEKITKMYNPQKTEAYLPKIFHKRNIKEIILHNKLKYEEILPEKKKTPTKKKEVEVKQQNQSPLHKYQEKLKTITVNNPQKQEETKEKKVPEPQLKTIPEQQVKKAEESNCKIM